MSLYNFVVAWAPNHASMARVMRRRVLAEEMTTLDQIRRRRGIGFINLRFSVV